MKLGDRLARVKALVFDVDGTLTDGSLWFGAEGEALKRFDVRDGHGFVMARETGLKVAWVTARTSPYAAARAKELRLADFMHGRRDKGVAFAELYTKWGLAPEACAYMGDDVNDLAALKLAGLAACPADATEEARGLSHFVCSRSGGHGAARELIDAVLKATGLYDRAIEISTGVPPSQ